jgi:hypothetical protein
MLTFKSALAMGFALTLSLSVAPYGAYAEETDISTVDAGAPPEAPGDVPDEAYQNTGGAPIECDGDCPVYLSDSGEEELPMVTPDVILQNTTARRS